MQVSVCCPDGNESRRICSLLGQIAAELSRNMNAVPFPSEDALWQAFTPGRFQGAVICCGDVRGFLCARRLREEDPACRVILLGDTDRYAIRALRIHLSDYLVCPVEDERLRQSLRLLFTE